MFDQIADDFGRAVAATHNIIATMHDKPPPPTTWQSVPPTAQPVHAVSEAKAKARPHLPVFIPDKSKSVPPGVVLRHASQPAHNAGSTSSEGQRHAAAAALANLAPMSKQEYDLPPMTFSRVCLDDVLHRH